jgi:twinfilin-like protein
MLYASTRASLVKSLGSALFTDSIFATDKHDLTPSAYLAHQRHQAAPKPLSSREQEIADLRVAENATASYEGSRSRASHVGTGVGLNWSPEAEQAIASLAQGDQCTIVILVSL